MAITPFQPIVWHKALDVIMAAMSQQECTCHFLNSGHTGYNGSLLGQLEGSQGQGDVQHGGHGNRNSAHNDDKHVGESGASICTAQVQP